MIEEDDGEEEPSHCDAAEEMSAEEVDSDEVLGENDASSESETGFETYKIDGSKPICHIGLMINEKCSLWGSRGKRLPTDIYSNCNEDISEHLLSIFQSGTVTADDVQKCPRANERWLLMNRLGCTIPDDALLCGKHRSKYGVGFKDTKCGYPGHPEKDVRKVKKRKGKGKSTLRVIPINSVKAVKVMNSTLLLKYHLPLGSLWCENCRKRRHPPVVEKYTPDDHVCLLCCENHDSLVPETPPKRQRLNENESLYIAANDGTPSSQISCHSQESQDSQVEFTPDGIEKDIFNKSMGNMDTSWTPLRHVVRTDIEKLNPKTKSRVVNKAIKAVDAVLENVAPGQGHILKDEIFKRHRILDLTKEIKESVESAVGNVKVQLLSLVAGKNEDGEYHHTINEIMSMFPGVTKHYVERARKHAGAGKTGVPIVPGVYTRKKLTDDQINHFLDFMQYGNLVQDVASGTRNVKLSTGRKTAMPNVVRIVHKAEIIRLYEAACEEEGYTHKPSTRTLWNILQMCPASQRKSLAGLDNVAADGSDAFDELSKILLKLESREPQRKEELRGLQQDLTKGKRYLKGDYKAHCKNLTSEIADHCRGFALSDPIDKKYQYPCDHDHKNRCNSCEDLKTVLNKFRNLELSPSFNSKETGVLRYEITEAISKIENWKAHILTVIHQDSHKYDVLAKLDDKTALVIIDFAMKYLARRYRESMSKWFGKAGNGMHVMCVIYKVGDKFRKRTYINFIGKSSQEVGSVMAIYESCLRQLLIDLPQIKCIIDKSDNAGCYHTETLFTWRALWTKNNTNHKFTETMFNERQAGKDQCDRDSATAKRQMNFFVNSGHNIENAEQMNEALRSATAICDFSSCVMRIESGSPKKPKNIKKISRIHHVKYIMENKKEKFHVWQYYRIGEGRKFPVGELPITPSYNVTAPFQKDHTFGNAMVEKKRRKEKEQIFCAEPMCQLAFESVDEMLHHFNFEEHDYVPNSTQLSSVADKWVDRFSAGDSDSLGPSSSRSVEDTVATVSSGDPPLMKGWAIPQRKQRTLTNLQKNFLNKLFDQGELDGAKVTGENALTLMKEELDPDQFLPLESIKSYFSRRAKKLCQGKTKIGELFPEDVDDVEKKQSKKRDQKKAQDKIEEDKEDEEVEEEEEGVEEEGDEEEEDESEEEIEVNENESEEQRKQTVSQILASTASVPDLLPDDWIAVDVGSTWFPGQFVEFDAESEELQVNFLNRSPSNPKWFVWPLFEAKGEEDKGWVSEQSVFYRLSGPKEGRRETLLFEEYDDFGKVFRERGM